MEACWYGNVCILSILTQRENIKLELQIEKEKHEQNTGTSGMTRQIQNVADRCDRKFELAMSTLKGLFI